MMIAGSMTMAIYNSEIHEIYHDLGYWIINQSHWYPDKKYTKEQAIEAFKKSENIQPKRSEMTVTPEMTARCLMMAGQEGRCDYEK